MRGPVAYPYGCVRDPLWNGAQCREEPISPIALIVRPADVLMAKLLTQGSKRYSTTTCGRRSPIRKDKKKELEMKGHDGRRTMVSDLR